MGWQGGLHGTLRTSTRTDPRRCMHEHGEHSSHLMTGQAPLPHVGVFFQMSLGSNSLILQTIIDFIPCYQTNDIYCHTSAFALISTCKSNNCPAIRKTLEARFRFGVSIGLNFFGCVQSVRSIQRAFDQLSALREARVNREQERLIPLL